MSQENVEIIRRGYAHFAENGDVPAEITHPDFVWDMSKFGGWPERQTYSGIEGAREFLAEWTAAWDDWKLELLEVLDAGEKVVGVVRQRGRSKATGLTVEMEFVQVWSIRDGLQIRMEMYGDRAAGLAAVGLDG